MNKLVIGDWFIMPKYAEGTYKVAGFEDGYLMYVNVDYSPDCFCGASLDIVDDFIKVG